MKGKVSKVAPNSKIAKVNNPIVMTDIDDSQEGDNIPAGLETGDRQNTDDNTQGVIIATDGSMISGRVDDIIKTDAEDEKDLVAVSEGGQCLKCMGFFSIMILLPALVFMFIHLGNNNWKFKI